MNDSVSARRTARLRANSESEPRWAPKPPSAALVPGVFLLFIGLWMLTDGGPLVLGWASVSVGAAFLLVGAVALGVVWGLDLHDERRG